jgi:glycosyltransferase involved in cell wall biosynthesis
VQLGDAVYERFAPELGRVCRITAVALPQPLIHVPLRWWLRLFAELRPEVFVLSKGGFGYRSIALDVTARLRARRYVVIEHHPTDPPPPRTSKRHLGGLVPGLALWWWRRHLASTFHLGAAHRVITDSDHVTDLLCEHFALSRRKAFRVHPGVDADDVRFSAAGRARLRSEWGIPHDALVLGSVGRLDPVKGLDRSLAAFAEVYRASSDAPWLVLAGEGSERDRLEQMAARLGVADRVCMPGYVENAADALSALDIYLLSSHSEGFGIALLEAMACERACVAMNSGGPAEILTDPSTGVLTPADDEVAFGATVRAVASLSGEDRARIGRRAREHVVRHFDRRTQMREIARLIVSA